jgi:STE24 endopeptidase
MGEEAATREPALDLERQRKAKQYARLQRRLMVVSLTLGGVYTLAWLWLGWSMGLTRALLDLTGSQWLLVAGMAAVFGGIYYLVTLPLTYYEGFVLPHRYKLSTQSFGGWVTDQVKSLALGAVLGGLILEIIYLVLRVYPDWWWLWAAGIMLLFGVLMANLAPVVLFPIFYDFEPLGEGRADLAERLMDLAERAGAQVRGVYKFDMSRRTTAANAALTGLGNTRRIILGDTLLEEFSDDEIETVLAHELGHHVHNDIPLSIAFESLTTLVGFYLASLVLNWGVAYFGFQGPWDVAAFPLFVLVIGLYGLITMPLGNAFSRWRERQADRYALQATGKNRAFASAMTRLANQNLADVDPEPWVVFLLLSHPPLRERIRMAQADPSTE